MSSGVCTIYTPTHLVFECTVLQSHLLGENSAALVDHYKGTFIIPPGMHCCYVARGNMD